ncbi:COG4223 family protein [Rhodoligotrophos ferricapiens]|uniref:COG4223 family protein n=1 Tax=Rhodoligotrophos ferricapiens TaxID=3069264 RepID=UPI00315D8417
MAQNDDLGRNSGPMRPGRGPVIDLSATEVKTEETASAIPEAGTDGAASAASGATASPDRPATGDAPQTDQAAAGEPANSASELHTGANQPPESPSHGDGLPPDQFDDDNASLRRWLRAGIGLLLLIAGVLGGILLYRNYGADYFPTPQTQDMLNRLPALEQASRENRNRLDSFSETVESLRSRIASFEEGLTGLRQQVEGMRQSIDETRNTAQQTNSTVTELRERLANAGPADPNAIASLRQALDAAGNRLQALESELGMLRQAQGDAGARSQDLDQLTQRLGTLEQTLQSQSQAEQQQQTERAEQAAGMASALEALRTKLANGESFRSEVDALRSRIGPSAELDQLATHADQGVPTAQTLQHRFATVRENLARAAARPQPAPSASTWDALVQRLKSVVQIRPLEEVDWTEVMSRMAPFVEAGDFAGAERVLATAGAPPPAPLVEWLEAAKMRRDADAALQAVTGQALAKIQDLSGSGN